MLNCSGLCIFYLHYSTVSARRREQHFQAAKHAGRIGDLSFCGRFGSCHELKIAALNAELPQMMVQMLVHQRSPFHRSQRAEKEVRMFRANLGPTRCKGVNRFEQPLPLNREIPFISHDNALVGHGIAAHWLSVHDQ